MAQTTKTISFKQTDSPVLEKFVKAQTNFSESVRYLILAYCKQNGIEDISHKLTELMFIPNYDFNSNLSNEIDNKNNEIEDTKIEKVIVENIDDLPVTSDILNEENHDEEDKENESNLEEIPSCYE